MKLRLEERTQPRVGGRGKGHRAMAVDGTTRGERRGGGRRGGEKGRGLQGTLDPQESNILGGQGSGSPIKTELRDHSGSVKPKSTVTDTKGRKHHKQWARAQGPHAVGIREGRAAVFSGLGHTQVLGDLLGHLVEQ